MLGLVGRLLPLPSQIMTQSTADASPSLDVHLLLKRKEIRSWTKEVDVHRLAEEVEFEKFQRLSTRRYM